MRFGLLILLLVHAEYDICKSHSCEWYTDVINEDAYISGSVAIITNATQYNSVIYFNYSFITDDINEDTSHGLLPGVTIYNIGDICKNKLCLGRIRVSDNKLVYAIDVSCVYSVTNTNTKFILFSEYNLTQIHKVSLFSVSVELCILNNNTTHNYCIDGYKTYDVCELL